MKTKDSIYQQLLAVARSGDFISGQELAARCGVSRTAVWKAVRILKRDGAKIEAITNRGYRIVQPSGDLSEEAVLSYLSEDYAGRISVYKTIDSTNTEAKRRCLEAGNLRNENGDLTEEGKRLHRSVIIANSQTAGRGRLGRTFYSPQNTGIYLSMIYAPRRGVAQPAAMTATAAVAVCRALEKIYGVQASIKWVNDVFVGGKKVCGILTEGVSNFESGRIETAIIGIGINIVCNEDGMPKELAKVAGAVLQNTDTVYSQSQLAAQVIYDAIHIYDAEEDADSVEKNDILNEYKKRSLVIGKKVRVIPLIGSDRKSYEALAVDIDSEARLIVRRLSDGSECALQSGEITLQSENFSSSS